MPASKMMTRSQYRASRSSAATQHDSKPGKAEDLLLADAAAVNPEQDCQTDATEEKQPAEDAAPSKTIEDQE